jgi:hypothetical protein
LDKDEAIKLTIKSLLEVVQTGAKNIEITYVDGFNQVKVSESCATAKDPAFLSRLDSSRTWTTKKWRG